MKIRKITAADMEIYISMAKDFYAFVCGCKQEF